MAWDVYQQKQLRNVYTRILEDNNGNISPEVFTRLRIAELGI